MNAAQLSTTAFVLLISSASASAAIRVYPEFAENRGVNAECFESTACMISGRLSNGQKCWVEEVDSDGQVLTRAWGTSVAGQELLVRQLEALGCEGCGTPADLLGQDPEQNSGKPGKEGN